MSSNPFRFIALVVLLLGLRTSFATAQTPPTFAKPPEVVSTKELKSMLDDRAEAIKKAEAAGKQPEEMKFVLVDVRSEDEISVSIIPGSITKEQFEKDKEKYKGKLVIPYCLVGGRSAAYANELKKSGMVVKNYKGSIVEWVMAEMPLVTIKGEATNKVFVDASRFKIPSKYEAVGK